MKKIGFLLGFALFVSVGLFSQDPPKPNKSANVAKQQPAAPKPAGTSMKKAAAKKQVRAGQINKAKVQPSRTARKVEVNTSPK